MYCIRLFLPCCFLPELSVYVLYIFGTICIWSSVCVDVRLLLCLEYFIVGRRYYSKDSEICNRNILQRDDNFLSCDIILKFMLDGLSNYKSNLNEELKSEIIKRISCKQFPLSYNVFDPSGHFRMDRVNKLSLLG